LCRVRTTRSQKFSVFSRGWSSGGFRGRVVKVGGFRSDIYRRHGEEGGAGADMRFTQV
jgi:hypothetical protein